MKGLFTVVAYRLFHPKIVALAVIYLVVGALLAVYHLDHGAPLINRLSEPALLSRLYFYDTHFFMRIGLLMLGAIMTYKIQQEDALDIPLVMRVGRIRLALLRTLCPTVVLLGVMGLSLLINLHVYAFAPFSEGFVIHHGIVLVYGVYVVYYTALFDLVMNRFKTLYHGMMVVLIALLGDVLMDFDTPVHAMRVPLRMLLTFFPVSVASPEGFQLSVSPLIPGMLAIAYMSLSTLVFTRKRL